MAGWLALFEFTSARSLDEEDKHKNQHESHAPIGPRRWCPPAPAGRQYRLVSHETSGWQQQL